MKEINNVVVAVDGTDGSLQAAHAAARVADAMDASLTLLYVFSLPPDGLAGMPHMSQEDFDNMRDTNAQAVFDKMTSALGKQTRKPEQVTLVGDPAAEILHYVDDRQDILAVMGRRGQSGIQALLLGSVSDKVVRHTRTPVTIVS